MSSPPVADFLKLNGDVLPIERADRIVAHLLTARSGTDQSTDALNVPLYAFYDVVDNPGY